MAMPILVLGKSGSGKSSSIRTLPHKKTFLINVCSKELPFKGASKLYTKLNSKGEGNMLATDSYETISNTINWISKERKDTKYIVIDDSQYLMVNEFMRKHSSAGKGNAVFSLYNDIGDHFWNLIWECKMLPIDAMIFFLHHSETTDLGEVKAKSIGKMLDEKVDIPGMFTCVFLAKRDGEENYFLTQNDGNSPAKTPCGMFDSIRIDNDLLNVSNKITQYNEGM